MSLTFLLPSNATRSSTGRFGQMHDQPFAGAIDRHLVEQAGRDQRLQRRVARGVVEPSVGRGVKIRAHGLGVDAAIAFDDDASRAAVRSRPTGAEISPSAWQASIRRDSRRQSLALRACV